MILEKLFLQQKLQIIEMSANEHDRLAANSQDSLIRWPPNNLLRIKTYIDRLFRYKETTGVIDQTCNDTWQLFSNLQHFNPYTKRMRLKLGETFDQLYNKLYPGKWQISLPLVFRAARKL